MARPWSLLLATGSLLVTGCIVQNLSASERLTQASFMLNDAARWGRLDVARTHVAPSYLESYAQRHQRWGNEIQIAEADVVSIQLDKDKEGATSRVNVGWYSTDAMSLRATTIVQRWTARGQSFFLVSEEIQGDPELFADETPPPTKGDDPQPG